MAYSFDTFTKSVAETADWLTREYSGIRTGRATPQILDSVRVESYGSMMSIKEVGSVGTEDARTLRVTPWDPSQVKAIEKGITAANLGLSVVTDERGITLSRLARRHGASGPGGTGAATWRERST